MGAVGTSEGIAGFAVEFGLDVLKIVFWHNDVGVKDDKVFALATFGAIVARRAWARVGLEVIADREAVGVFLTNSVAFFRRAVFHHNDFKVFDGLAAKALKQFVDFLGSVEDRYDD
jgi:hypothetical protein